MTAAINKSNDRKHNTDQDRQSAAHDQRICVGLVISPAVPVDKQIEKLKDQNNAGGAIARIKAATATLLFVLPESFM